MATLVYLNLNLITPLVEMDLNKEGEKKACSHPFGESENMAEDCLFLQEADFVAGV